VAYGTDLEKAKQVILDTLYADPLVLMEPKAPIVAVSELNNSSVDFSIWVWVGVDDYWTLWMRIRENLYNAFYANGITIPFPQMDVHIKCNNEELGIRNQELAAASFLIPNS